MVDEPDDSQQQLGGRASRGAAVTMIGQLGRIGVQLIGIVVLARVLDPADFGLAAMAVAIVGMGEVVRDFGLTMAAVQAKTLSKEEKDNLFWANTLIGIVIAAIVFLISWPVGAIYGDDRVVGITQLLSLTFLFNGIASQFRGHLQRNLSFLLLTIAEVGGLAIGVTTGILMGVAGFSYWAIVGQQISQTLSSLIMVVIFSRWLPGWFHRTTSIRHFLRFGGHLVGSSLLEYASKNTDSVVIGIQFGPTALGLYNRAFQLLTVPLNQLGPPASRVAVPVLSKLHSEPEKFTRYLLTGQTALLHLTMLIFGAMWALAEPAVAIVLGAQFAESASLFRILCIAGIFQAATYGTYWVFLSKGLTKANLQYSLVLRPIIIVMIILGSLGSVESVAWGYALGTAISWPLALFWISRVSDSPVMRMFLNGLRAILAYGLASIVGFFVSDSLTDQLDIVQCLAGGCAMLVVLALEYLVWLAYRRDVDLFKALLAQLALRSAQTRRARKKLAEAERAEADLRTVSDVG
jgi:PST family polysaccharide transporter